MKKLFVLVLLFSYSAHGILGEKSNSIQQFRTQSKATNYKAKQSANYSIHEMVIDGNTVKEYVTQDGDVFAVTWQGIKSPDLSVLFGRYYSEYQDAREEDKKTTPKGKRQGLVRSSNLVVQRSGHMRDLRGQACLPSLVPVGLSCESLP